MNIMKRYTVSRCICVHICFAVPIRNSDSQLRTVAKKIQVRPLPESLMLRMGEKLVYEEWDLQKSPAPPNCLKSLNTILPTFSNQYFH